MLENVFAWWNMIHQTHKIDTHDSPNPCDTRWPSEREKSERVNKEVRNASGKSENMQSKEFSSLQRGGKITIQPQECWEAERFYSLSRRLPTVSHTTLKHEQHWCRFAHVTTQEKPREEGKTARKSATRKEKKEKSGLNSEVNQGYFSSVFPLTQYVCALLEIPSKFKFGSLQEAFQSIVLFNPMSN